MFNLVMTATGSRGIGSRLLEILMKVGDLVRCNCQSETWYQGRVGMLIGFDHFGVYSTEKGDPLVMYLEGTVRLAGSALEVVS